jgi:shikimate dehydrogenase
VSPSMHNAAFAAAGIDAVYLPLPAVDADDFLAFGRAIGISGASVTIPHKVSLFDRVDDVDAIARRIGAINTIRVADGKWLARNTDVNGFLNPLLNHVALEGRRAAILGAGGAARAVAVALASSGCTVSVHARQRHQAEDVAALVSARAGSWPPAPDSWDLLVNCTPIGMYPNVDDTPLPAERLTGSVVYDLVYNPPTTRLLREAAARGCRTIGGLDMLVGQAQEQFAWWTGAVPPAGVMRQAAERRLTEFTRNEDYVV